MDEKRSGDARTDLDSLAIETIEATIKLIENPARWIQGIAAAVESGRECSPAKPEATCFCLYAALRRAGGTTGSDGEAVTTPGLRDVHDAIERRLWANGQELTYNKGDANPGRLLIRWNDDPELCGHGDVMEVLADAITAIRVRGRALAHDEEPQTRLQSTGNRALDEALWRVMGTLSNENHGNSELSDAADELHIAWEQWQNAFH